MGKFMHGHPLISHSEINRHHYSLAAIAVGLGIGVSGLCKALHSGLTIPWVSPTNLFSGSERVYYIGGLRNLGNNCFLNVILQALASCDCFVSFLDNLLGIDSLLSLDFENFQSLPLSPVLDTNGEIISRCSLVDCLKHFTMVEHLDNYRCDRCWHLTAAKYLSVKSEVDEGKVSKLHSCVDYGTCSCKRMFSPDGHVSQVPEDDVLGAEATLLFYERL